MDKAIFQFDSCSYSREQVIGFDREICEHLCNVDEDNVTKFDLEGDDLEYILNDNSLDIDNCWYKVFIE